MFTSNKIDFLNISTSEYHWAIEINKKLIYFKTCEEANEYINQFTQRPLASKTLQKTNE